MCDLHITSGLDCLDRADTIIIPGNDCVDEIEPAIIDALVSAAGKGVRIASICSGAFILAATGLLNGLRATTHWAGTDLLAARFPQIEVVKDALFIDNGKILTSAGVASGIDLCLHMIRQDYGAVAAADVAETIVMPLERDGRQSQRINYKTPDDNDNLNHILLWIMENLDQKLSVKLIADRFGLSSRTLNRWFSEQSGTTPLQWVLTARIRQSQKLLESTSLSIEEIATFTGFSSASAFRERFRQVVGVAPTTWRNTYK